MGPDQRAGRLPQKRSVRPEKAQDYRKYIVNLPCSTNLTEQDCERVIAAVKNLESQLQEGQELEVRSYWCALPRAILDIKSFTFFKICGVSRTFNS